MSEFVPISSSSNPYLRLDETSTFESSDIKTPDTLKLVFRSIAYDFVYYVKLADYQGTIESIRKINQEFSGKVTVAGISKAKGKGAVSLDEFINFVKRRHEYDL